MVSGKISGFLRRIVVGENLKQAGSKVETKKEIFV